MTCARCGIDMTNEEMVYRLCKLETRVVGFYGHYCLGCATRLGGKLGMSVVLTVNLSYYIN